MADLSQQLQLQQQINAALSERNRILEAQNNTMRGQADLASDLAASLGSSRVNNNINMMNGALQRSSSALKDTKSTAKDLEAALNDAADAAEEASEQTGFFAEAIGNLGSVLGGIGSVLGSVGSAFLSIAGSIAKAAFSIFTFPLKIFGSLVQMAQEGSGDMPIAKAFEDLRDVLGDLSTGPAKAVKDTFNGIRNSSRKLAGTTLTVRKVFGYGRDGLAALLKDLTELAAASGDRIGRLGPIFERMADKAIIFQRGLGVSKEEFADLIDLAELRGEDPEKAMTRFSKSSVVLAKRFNLSVKDMAKGMKELTLDVANFGHLGERAFGPLTVYARKLGLEIKDMASIMDKFAGFADSAEAASKLGQVFQMAVDPMQLMAAQNPAEKIDLLRDAFFKAGKSLKDFSFQERKYLAQTTGLPPKAMEAAFALQNQSQTYANIAAEAKDAEKTQMSQKQVLQELQKGIKRLIEVLDMPKVTGFFDAFMKGFERGIMRSKEFRGTLRAIRRGLQHMMRFGIEIGKLFASVFPGMKQMLNGLSEFLSIKRFKAFTAGLKPIFKMFFEGRMGVAGLFSALKQRLTGQFAPRGLKKVFDGFLKFTNAVAKILMGILDEVFKFIRKRVIPFVESVLDDADAYVAGGKGRLYVVGIVKSLGKHINDAFGQVGGFATKILDAFAPLGRLFDKDGELVKMLESAKPVVGRAVDMLGADFKEIGRKIGCGIYEGLMSIWNSTSFGEKILYGGLLAVFLAPMTMARLGMAAGKAILRGLGAVLGISVGAAGKAAVAGGKALTVAGGKVTTSGMGLVKGALVKRDAAKALKAAEAASKTAAMTKATTSAVSKGLTGAAKASHIKKLYDKTYNNMMKAHRSNISRGTSKFLKEGTKQAIKESTKVATTGLATAGKVVKGVLSKGVPLLFDFAYGLYEAFNAKEGEGGQRFVSGVVSSLTFGVWSTDELQDAFFGTNKVMEKLSAQTSEAITRHQEKMYSHYQALAAKNNNVYRGLIEESQFLADLIVSTSVKLKGKLTAQEKTVIASLKRDANAAQKAAKTAQAAAKSEIERMQIVSDTAAGLSEQLTERMSEHFPDAIALGVKETKAFYDAIGDASKKKLEELGVTTKDGMLEINKKAIRAARVAPNKGGAGLSDFLMGLVVSPTQLEKMGEREAERGMRAFEKGIVGKGGNKATQALYNRIVEGEKLTGTTLDIHRRILDKRITNRAFKKVASDFKKKFKQYQKQVKAGTLDKIPDYMQDIAKVYGFEEGKSLYKLASNNYAKTVETYAQGLIDNKDPRIQKMINLAGPKIGGAALETIRKIEETSHVTFKAGNKIRIMRASAGGSDTIAGDTRALGGSLRDPLYGLTAQNAKAMAAHMAKRLKARAEFFQKIVTGPRSEVNVQGTMVNKKQAAVMVKYIQSQQKKLEAIVGSNLGAANKAFVMDTAKKFAEYDLKRNQKYEGVLITSGRRSVKMLRGMLNNPKLAATTKSQIKELIKLRESQVRELLEKGLPGAAGAGDKEGKTTEKALETTQQKLSKLEQQRFTTQRITEMMGIPQQLKAAKKAFARINIDRVKKDAEILFAKAAKIGVAIDASLEKSGIAAFATKKVEDSKPVKGAIVVATIIDTSVNALEQIAGSARRLKKVIANNLKFFKKLDLACLACQVYDMAAKASNLPVVLSVGLKPLLGEAVPAVEGEGGPPVPTGEKLNTGLANTTKGIAVLDKITTQVSTASFHFETLAAEITKINGIKIPEFTEKRKAKLKGLILIPFEMLSIASNAVEGGGLKGIAQAIISGPSEPASKNLQPKLEQATKNLAQLGLFFLTAKKVGRTAAGVTRYKAAVQQNAEAMADAISTIAAQGEKLHDDTTEVVSVLDRAKGGTVEVRHKFGDKVKLNVNVKINAEELGNRIFRVDVGGAKDQHKQFGFATRVGPSVSARA